jgi:hypothetical protein
MTSKMLIVAGALLFSITNLPISAKATEEVISNLDGESDSQPITQDVIAGILEAGKETFLKNRNGRVTELEYDSAKKTFTVVMTFSPQEKASYTSVNECTIGEVSGPSSIMAKFGLDSKIQEALKFCFGKLD